MKKKILAMLLAVVMIMAMLPTAFAADSGLSVKVKAADGSEATITISSATVLEALVPFEAGNEWVTVIMMASDAAITFDKAVNGVGYMGDWNDETESVNYFAEDGSAPAAAGTWTGSAIGMEGGPFFGYWAPEYGEGMYMVYDLVGYTTPDGDSIYIDYAGMEEFFLETKPGELPGEDGESEASDPISVKVKAEDGSEATITISSGTVLEALVPFELADARVTVIMVDRDATITFDKTVYGIGYFGAYMLAILEEGDYDSDDMSYFYGFGDSIAEAGSYTYTYALDGPFFGFSDDSDPYGWGTDEPVVWLFDMVGYTAANGNPIFISLEGMEEFFLETKPGELPGEDEEPTEPEDPAEPELPTKFTDVPAGAYYAKPVAWAVEKGITNGTSATAFGPDDKCTRAQIVTFLWIAHGKQEPTTTENPFTDVKPSDYYYKAVLWAVENKITSGVGNNKFGSNDECTRAQAVTFQYLAAGSPAVSGGSSFTDVPADAYYANAVAWAAANGITGGIGNNQFGSGNDCLRAQVVTFLYNDPVVGA